MPDVEYLTIDHLSSKELTRIFSKIQIDQATGCWNWSAGRTSEGYGKIRYNGRTELSHRVLYAFVVGPVPRRRKGEKTPNFERYHNLDPSKRERRLNQMRDYRLARKRGEKL